MQLRFCRNSLVIIFLSTICLTKSDLFDYWKYKKAFAKIPEGYNIFHYLDHKKACKMCTELSKFIKEKRLAMKDDKREFSDEDIGAVIVTACVALKISTKDVCIGLVTLNMPVLMRVMIEKNLNECDVCKVIFEYKNCCDGGPAKKWTLPLEKYGPKPPDCSKFARRGGKRKKIAHITDLHWDQQYVIGSTNECEEPICCGNPDNMPKDKAKQAGLYGSYRKCDVPMRTLDTTLESIKEIHGPELEFVIVTGDFVEHTIWDMDEEVVGISMMEQTALINQYFPKTPVFYAIGNHDGYPPNLFVPPQVMDISKWIFTLFNEQWSTWLDDNARGTIDKGGFYTFRGKDGPRIISLNSMFCYNLNWFLAYDPVDPAGQLIWLADTLIKAEEAGEMVYIIQHISVGTVDCLQEYSRELWRILTRFHCIIKGLFTGHVHRDETRLIYDIDDLSKPIISVHNGGSVTSYIDVNPNYKIYEVEEESWDVLNAESWIFDLGATQKNPEWIRLYSFRDEFKVPSIRPEDLHNVIMQLANDENLMRKYNSFYGKGAKTPLVDDCDANCLRQRLCDMVTTTYSDTRKCDELPKAFPETRRQRRFWWWPISGDNANSDENIVEDPNQDSLYDEISLTSRLSDNVKDGLSSIKNTLTEVPLVTYIMDAFDQTVTCKLCLTVAKYVVNRLDNSSDEDIAISLISICTYLQLQTEKVCTGVIKLNLPTMLYIIREKNLKACDICQTVFERKNCCYGEPVVRWSLSLEKYGDRPEDCSASTSKSLNIRKTKIAHITDTHWDQKYIAGSLADCEEPLCCRDPNLTINEPGDAAGEYGDYIRCDIPLKTLNSALRNLKQEHGPEISALEFSLTRVITYFTFPDVPSEEVCASRLIIKCLFHMSRSLNIVKFTILYLYVTGDFVEHNIWSTTEEQVEMSIKTQTQLINYWFPDTPVFYCFGNHDINPTNQFVPTSVNESTKWGYKLFLREWTEWIDDEARQTIAKGGYYTYVTKEGLRIISLNSMFCYCLNWWMMYDPRDPGDQLTWLADTLLEAESKKQMVHILMHITVGDADCLSEYSRELWRILSRFHCNIKGVFTGHLHADELRIVYDIDNLNEPIIPVHNGGSITNYISVNSNYKIYEIDTDYWEPVNAESWVFNLADTKTDPKWYRLYSFKDEFGVPSTKPRDLDKAVRLMAENEHYMEKYNWYYAKGANTPMVTNCNAQCSLDRLCNIVKSNYANDTKCNELYDIVNY